MPVKSKSQFKLVQAKRSKYGSKSKTPESWKWIWKKEWIDIDYKNLPEKVKKENIMKKSELTKLIKEVLTESYNNKISYFELIESPEFKSLIDRKLLNKIVWDLSKKYLETKKFIIENESAIYIIGTNDIYSIIGYAIGAEPSVSNFDKYLVTAWYWR